LPKKATIDRPAGPWLPDLERVMVVVGVLSFSSRHSLTVQGTMHPYCCLSTHWPSVRLLLCLQQDHVDDRDMLRLRAVDHVICPQLDNKLPRFILQVAPLHCMLPFRS
jgi:hypothetical protein